MKCKWRVTDERHRTGRTILRCARSRCRQFGLMPETGDPKHLDADCFGWPFAQEWGHWAELFLAALGLSRGNYLRLKQSLGLAATCGCDGRISVFNKAGSAVVSWCNRGIDRAKRILRLLILNFLVNDDLT